jgi:hypothetical protein
LPEKLTIREDAVDHLSHAAQALAPFSVLASEITDLCSRGRIAYSELGKNQVLLGMMVRLQVNFEIVNNRANDLVVGAFPPKISSSPSRTASSLSILRCSRYKSSMTIASIQRASG